MSKTYLEVGAGTMGSFREFGYNPVGFEEGDRLVLADLRVRFGCEKGLEDAAGYSTVIFPTSASAESFLANPNCDGIDCKLCKAASIQHQHNKNFESLCKENGVELAHVYSDGIRLSFRDNVFDEVLYKNVFSDPRMSDEDARALLEEAARVSLGGVATLIETYTPGLGVSGQKLRKAASDAGLHCEMYSTDNEGLISFDLEHRLALNALSRYNTAGLEIPMAHVYFLRSE